LPPSHGATVIIRSGPGPEVALLKARYAGAFQRALDQALAELTVRERNLLRLHFVDGMSVDKLGVAYNVHRATAARWIRAARDGLMDRVRARLRAELRLPVSEIDSLVALVQSQLEVSLSQALGC
jgi:RNA polymerase sigma-70 factor (ECF subfamily)